MAEDDRYDKLQKMATDPKELVDLLSVISFLPPEKYRKKIRGSGGSRRVPLEADDVRVEIESVDRYGPTVGKVWVDDRYICREMVREGHAWVYRRYSRDRSLLKDERAAQQAATGLWGLPKPVAPWEWRSAR